MAKLQSILFVASVTTLLSEHPLRLANLLLMIPTAAGEQLLETLAFRCPKDPAIAVRISLIFLCFPVFILYIMSMVMNARFWYVYHGVRRNRNQLKRREKFGTFFIIAYQSLTVPFVWLFVALLDGTYIVCIFSDDPDELTDLTIQIYAQSQTAAWCLLLGVVIIGTMVTCSVRCCCVKETFLEGHYDETYRKKLEEQTKKKATEKAEEKATLFVEANIGNNEAGNRRNQAGNEKNPEGKGNAEREEESPTSDKSNNYQDSGVWNSGTENERKGGIIGSSKEDLDKTSGKCRKSSKEDLKKTSGKGRRRCKEIITSCIPKEDEPSQVLLFHNYNRISGDNQPSVSFI